MELISVEDIDIQNITDNKYDLAFFSCGYEQRAITVSQKLNKRNINKSLTLYFAEQKGLGNRTENESHFDSFSDEIIEMKYDEELPIYDFLNKYVKTNKSTRLKILVDYSSMSRLWYISILNWSKFVDFDQISIDFVYSVGEYKKDFTPLVINEILALPGHEGVTTHSKTISIFGLGFDSLTTLCVLDKLEPSIVHSFIALPVFKEYENKTEEYNKEFIENYSEPVQYFPLTSLENTFRLMSELISPYRDNYNISFIPMGPKPHVLASALLSSKYKKIINLYVKGKRSIPPNVISSGKFICTKVVFVK